MRTDAANPFPPQATETTAEAVGPLGLLPRRRRLVVDQRYQLRAGLITGSLTLLLLVILNASLFFVSRGSALEAAGETPELREFLLSQDRAQLVLTVLGSGVFLVGVLLVSLFESHRTAGAAFQIERVLGELRDGRWDSRVRLRRGDHLPRLASAVNDLAAAAYEREVRELEVLEDLAVRLETLGGEPAIGEVAQRLRERTIERRRILA